MLLVVVIVDTVRSEGLQNNALCSRQSKEKKKWREIMKQFSTLKKWDWRATKFCVKN
jgi:hypothetical protein